jgi:hypothetical protein
MPFIRTYPRKPTLERSINSWDDLAKAHQRPPRMGNAKLKRHLPILLALAYAAFYVAVLVKNVIYSVGDQTDVIRAGIAALPLGWVLAFTYPGGRNGAFVAVSCCALLNTIAIFFYTHSLVRNSS